VPDIRLFTGRPWLQYVEASPCRDVANQMKALSGARIDIAPTLGTALAEFTADAWASNV
jgi:hypothetical protein